MPLPFFARQADYVCFLNGLLYFLLSVVAYSLHRLEKADSPWRFLALSALVRTAAEWIDVLQPGYGDLPFLAASRPVLLAASFLLLAECARLGRPFRGSGRPAGAGRWVLVPLALLGASGGLAGWTGLEATVRLFLGTSAGLWAAWALHERGRERAPEERRPLELAAAAVAVYALASGFVPPRAAFPPALSWNREAFQAATGIPFRNVEALAILAALIGLGRHFHLARRRLDPDGTGLRFEIGVTLALAFIAAGGWVGTESMGRYTEDGLRRTILEKTRLAASLVERKDVDSLRWSLEDLASPGYLRLKAAMGRLRASSPDLRFASLMGWRDGRVYVLVDSENPLSVDYSPPGQWYQEVDADYARRVAAREDFVNGPTTDRWGTWMSGVAHVVEAADGAAAVSLALDIDAGDWNARVARTRLLGILLFLLLGVAALFLFLVLQRQKEANARTVAALRRMHDQRAAVLRLAVSKELTEGAFPDAARAITETAARTQGVARAGVWLGSLERGSFRCEDLFTAADGAHGREDDIPVEAHRRYFEALEAGRVIDASEARTDARTAEFDEGYLAPRGIVSLLDAPIRVRGRLAGIVSFEHVGAPRRWRDDEVRFAGEVADQAAQALLNEERRRAEAERAALEEGMRHTQKLESLGVMAGGIAHDFNNLLMGIQGNAELAMADIPSSSPARECVEEVQRTTQRAAELCQQMLAYAGRARFTVGTVDLNALAAEMAQILEVTVSKKAALRFAFDPEAPAVQADAAQLRQVVMNLVLNASESLGEAGGSVTVSTGTMDCSAADLSSIWLHERLPEGRYAWIEVADTGCGMDAETQARIFDPFFTTKFQGRGLGLAAVLGIVRAHRGAIRVESAPGRGTALRVLLPSAAPSPAEPPEEPWDAAWRGSGTVLFVDDEPEIRDLGRRLLTRLGFSVLTASDGKECLEAYARDPEGVSCVLLDLSMPSLDGAETLRELRRIRRGVRVVLSSGYGDEEIARRLSGDPPAGFIQKPYRLSSLARTLKDVLGGG